MIAVTKMENSSSIKKTTTLLKYKAPTFKLMLFFGNICYVSYKIYGCKHGHWTFCSIGQNLLRMRFYRLPLISWPFSDLCCHCFEWPKIKYLASSIYAHDDLFGSRLNGSRYILGVAAAGSYWNSKMQIIIQTCIHVSILLQLG